MTPTSPTIGSALTSRPPAPKPPHSTTRATRAPRLPERWPPAGGDLGELWQAQRLELGPVLPPRRRRRWARSVAGAPHRLRRGPREERPGVGSAERRQGEDLPALRQGAR